MDFGHIVVVSVASIIYCVSTSGVMTGLFMIAQPKLPCTLVFRHVLTKTLLSLGIVLGFFFFLSRMFCWTAWLAQCIECICPVLTADSFIMQNTIPSALLLFFGMSAVQLALIPIPQRLAPTAFVIIMLASNVVASLLKLGLVAVWGL